MKHRLIAPRGFVGAVSFGSGETLHIPPSGIVEFDDAPEYVALDNFSPRPYVQSRDYLAVLLRLGFTHAPPAGGAADRPPGRYPGEQFYCTDSGRPLWWDGRGVWRTAAGESV